MTNLEMIQQKINNSEGFIETTESGLIPVSQQNPNENIIWKPTRHDYNLVNIIYDEKGNPIDGKLELKTEEQKAKEIKIKQQQKILNELKSLRDAINFQQIGIDKGIDPSKVIFTEQQVVKWCEYITDIANGNLEVTQPELTQTQKTIFRL